MAPLTLLVEKEIVKVPLGMEEGMRQNGLSPADGWKQSTLLPLILASGEAGSIGMPAPGTTVNSSFPGTVNVSVPGSAIAITGTPPEKYFIRPR